MEKRQLGRSGIEVPILCFGGNVFGWTVDEPTSFRLLDAAFAAGLNFIDTADMYSIWVPGNQGGESETIIGNWMKARGNREKVIIASKVGVELSPDRKGLSKAYIRKAVEASLKRLRTDYIDLYQSHIDDKATALEETLEAYGDLIREGKVRTIGASNYSAERLREALAVSARTGLPRYESLQPEYNLYDRENFESSAQQVCRSSGLGVISYSSLASRFLTGKYRSEHDFGKSPRGHGMGKYLNDRGLRILKTLDRIARKHKTGQAQIALAWLLARPGLTSPIASATTVEQVHDLIAATKLTLERSDIDALDEASATKAVQFEPA
ncbi:aldo/keto reductase [Microvirga lenta]|uniref:aldo/keto reductase n=1 Tax=Microvirga lenta TaxID=2881337 RepID=UPI001CFFF002|nr:aldo/keto reductase [Microvirga lenta]MCB5175696.1 aldo/keto reductase [Microvirga lenta]